MDDPQRTAAPDSTPTFSLIVPTRQRVQELKRFLDSLVRTARHPEALEVILVVDEDDAGTRAFAHDRNRSRETSMSRLRHVVVVPGLTMGALNQAGYAASTGQFVMLLNDDVVVRTRHWDEIILRQIQRFADATSLIHVNDRLFGETLCTFPLVSRTFCELAGGICPADYRRYRIDDHIEEVFHLLAVLGEWRMVYLPDVVFEHHHFVEAESGRRSYVQDEAILAEDTRRFAGLFAERKEIALHLMETLTRRERSDGWVQRLEAIPDSQTLRQWMHHAREARHRARGQRSLWRRIDDCVSERGVCGLAETVWRRLIPAGQ